MKHRLKDGTVLQLRTQLPYGSVERRVKKLEVWMQSAVAESERHLTYAEWEQHLILHAQQGLFDHEPDFHQALKEYQDAVRQTQDDPTQHFYPPPEFMPQAPELTRQSAWQEGRKYPAIQKAFLWVGAMYYRMLKQEPGVSLAEWNSLKTWFLSHYQSWASNAPAHRLLSREDKKLDALVSDVEDDDGKSKESSDLIRLLRMLWACCYGTELVLPQG